VDGERDSDRTVTSVALGMLLLAGDQARAIIEAAREQLQLAADERAERDEPVATGRGGSVRQPLIGALFDVQRQAAAAGLAGARRGRSWMRGAGRTAVWLRGARRTAVWAWQAPPLGGLRSRVEAETTRLTRIGAAEEARARRLAAAAAGTAVDRVTRALLDQEFEVAYRRALARMLETPEIAELVREQSAGLAQELAESVRSRAVGADDVVERLIGRVLRRPGAVGPRPPATAPPPAPAPQPPTDGAEA
jgi:hypothetical protein